jgi:hypothetical protein
MLTQSRSLAPQLIHLAETSRQKIYQERGCNASKNHYISTHRVRPFLKSNQLFLSFDVLLRSTQVVGRRPSSATMKVSRCAPATTTCGTFIEASLTLTTVALRDRTHELGRDAD